MRPVAAIFILALALVATTPSRAEACSCQYLSTEERFDHADAVFEGTIVAVHAPIADGRSVQPFLFEVSDAWKGIDAGARVPVYSTRYGSSCGPPFEDGESWIVFAYRSEGVDGSEVPVGELWGSAGCGGAGRSEDAGTLRDELDGASDQGCHVGVREQVPLGMLLVVVPLLLPSRREVKRIRSRTA
jgi:hypothetical protein